MAEFDRRFFETIMGAKRLSMRALAARMGKTHSQLSLVFSGQRRMQLDEAAQLSEILGVPLHRIAEAAGAGRARPEGKRVDVVGVVAADGRIRPAEGVQRTTAPSELPDGVVAIQVRTADTAASWMDGFVLFFTPTTEVEPDAVGRLCVAKIADGEMVLATVRRGYRENTYNLSGPYSADSKRLEWASPVLTIRT